MKLTFYGATQEVTGSMHLVEVNGKRILLECGLYQGPRAETYTRNLHFPFEVASIDTVIITVPDASAIPALPDSPAVIQTEPDYFVSALVDVPTSDPQFAQQWALPVLNAPAAWLQLPADMRTVSIAVIDSGICADHPDLLRSFHHGAGRDDAEGRDAYQEA